MKPVIYFTIGIWMVLLNIHSLHAEDELLVYGATSDLNKEQLHYFDVIKVEETNINLEVVYLDGSKLLTEETIALNLPSGNAETMVIDKREVNSSTMTSVFGHFENRTGSAHIVVDNRDVTAMLMIEHDIWALAPLIDGPHVLYEINQSLYPHDESDEAYEQMLANVDMSFEVDDIDDIVDEAGKSSAGMAGSCKIRIGVVYTDDVRAAHSNVLAKIQNAINITNTAFDNSTVNTDIELAFAIERSYGETGNIDGLDLPRFRNTNDGFMDDVHTIRNRYNADLMHLLVKDGGSWCGFASGIGSSSSTAFCVTDIDCAEGNQTFGHEQAHLYGCRHDLFVDPNPFPLIYAHGYANTSIGSRTVMAYNDACTAAGTSCTRELHYSDPTIDFPGTSSPTGTTTFEHNERVMDDADNSIINFRSESFGQNFISTIESIGNREFADVLAVTSISAVSPQYHIENGGTAVFRASALITLGPGFHAKPGSSFDAFLDNCTNNTSPPQKEAAEIEDIPVMQQLEDLAEQMEVSPNPFMDKTMISLSLSEDANVSVSVFDVSGRQIELLAQNQQLPSGNHRWNFDGKQLNAGTYICAIVVDGRIHRKKLILTK